MNTLFTRHRYPLLSYFRNMGVRSDDAEDLVQEVFWRMLRYRESFQNHHSFRAWMFQIARNSLRDAQKKRPPLHLDSTGDDPTDAISSDPRETATHQSDVEHLRIALDTLPESKREILVLARFQHFTHLELANVLGCSEGAAKVRLHRALNALRQSYTQQLHTSISNR